MNIPTFHIPTFQGNYINRSADYVALHVYPSKCHVIIILCDLGERLY